jgi:hypothetical protein
MNGLSWCLLTGLAEVFAVVAAGTCSSDFVAWDDFQFFFVIIGWSELD